jgi:hypothetical protein
MHTHTRTRQHRNVERFGAAAEIRLVYLQLLSGQVTVISGFLFVAYFL